MASRAFNPKAFFKKTSSELVDRFFRNCGYTPVLDETKPEKDRYYFYWSILPLAERDKTEKDLKLINDMCCDKARWYLERAVDDVHVLQPDLIVDVKEFSNHDLAMTLFLDARDQFMWAFQIFSVDTMENLKDYRGRYHLPPLSASEERKEAFTNRLKDFFKTEFGGEGCAVEDYYSDEKMILVVYHYYYPRRTPKLNDGDVVEVVNERPTERIATVFYPEEMIFKVKAPRKSVRDEVRDSFAEIFAEDPDYFEAESDDNHFHLARLQEDDFRMDIPSGEWVTDARVTNLTFAVPIDKKPVVSISIQNNCLLRGTLSALGYDLRDVEIKGLRIQFQFKGGKGKNTRTARLSLPNNSNLNDSEKDRVIRQFLRQWNIERVQSNVVASV